MNQSPRLVGIDGTDLNTLYVADSGLKKYALLDSGQWGFVGEFLITGSVILDVTAVVKGPTDVDLFTTDNMGRVEKLTDTSGAGKPFTGQVLQVVALAPTNTAFRGVVQAPDDGLSTFGGFGSTTSYSANAAAIQVDSSATLSDLSSFNGGSLTVHLARSGTVSDLLTSNDTLAVGTFGNISVSGNSVLDNGAQIGTLSGGTGGSDLTIDFDSVVNTLGGGGTEYTVISAQVQDLLQAITFASTGANGNRTVQFTVVKNGGVDSSSAPQTVSVTGATVSLEVSRVGSLNARQTSDAFNVPASYLGTSSLISSVDLYASANGGPYLLVQSLPVSPPATSGGLTFSFTGSDRTIYTFHTLAHDQAGDTESKLSNLIEASTYIPDLTPPVTHVISSSPTYSFSPFAASLFSGVPVSSYANGVFTLNVAGATVEQSSGSPAGSIASFQIYVSVDGAPAQQVALLSGGSADVNGVYSVSTTYAAQGDGLALNYTFYSIGVDDQGVAQAAPATADVTFSSIIFTAPLQTSSLIINNGMATRSLIFSLDVIFNQSLLSSPPSAALTSLKNGLAGNQPGAFVEMEYYGSNLTTSSTPKSALTLFGTQAQSDIIPPVITLSGSDLSIQTPGGLSNYLPGSNRLTDPPSAGDGWYALGIDPTGNPSNHQFYWLTFFRLAGDVNGDEVVTGSAATAGSDVNIVNGERGQSGTRVNRQLVSRLNGDVNGDGDGFVNNFDMTEVIQEVNRSVGATAPQNFPTFQIMAGTPGPGTAMPVTTAQVQGLVPAAIAAWEKAGLNATGVQLLQKTQIQLVDLGGNILGQEFPGLIQINSSAAGYNWNLSAGSPAREQVDLRTVLEHEMGHILGLPDNDQAGDLMDIGLGLGVSRAPSEFDMAALSQALRSAGTYSAGNSLVATLAANRVNAGAYSTSQLNGAVELILAQPVIRAMTAEDSSARSLLQYVASSRVILSKDFPADDPGQDALSNDLLQNAAVRPWVLL